MSPSLSPATARAEARWGSAPLPPRPALTYGMGTIARRLGCDQRSHNWQVNYLRQLIKLEGFPAPLPHPRGTKLLVGAEAVGTHARWQRIAVDAWFDGQLPPGALEALTPGAAAEADALDANAGNLDALLAQRRRG
ncbi:hypothetical protein [Sphingomonas jatrophae]|uniref:Uncharacterized protein n=1 Tax=Sphingomonas jatrophae TaxID=1166337 RepID=A0A1I6K6F4_9SPHN|nr:hypothetical protein [Sphingomonas jatrophae]SFR86776.1 hypothetical protein SAMN05192580_1375 [Sphingomonas jatrophae]